MKQTKQNNWERERKKNTWFYWPNNNNGKIILFSQYTVEKAIASREHEAQFFFLFSVSSSFYFTLESVWCTKAGASISLVNSVQHNRWSKISQIFRLCHAQTRTESYTKTQTLAACAEILDYLKKSVFFLVLLSSPTEQDDITGNQTNERMNEPNKRPNIKHTVLTMCIVDTVDSYSEIGAYLCNLTCSWCACCIL